MGKMKVGECVVYVDDVGRENLALITSGFTPSTDGAKGAVNLVLVSQDGTKTDTYGRQIERQTSVVHQSSQSAPGNYWKDLGE